MAALTIVQDPSMPMAPSLVDTQPLAIGIAVVGLAILAFGLVAARFDQQAALNSERELARFRQLTDATFSGVFVYRDNIILDVNAAFCTFMGCEPSELIGHTVGDCVAPEYRARLAERIRAGQLENAEFVVIIKSGARRTVEVITRMVDYRGGKASMIAVRDITDRKREDLLRAEEHRILTDIAENQPLEETVAAVCRVAEAAMPEAICSVLLVTPEGTLRTVPGPQLPPEYSAAIDGAPIGSKAGSCGTAAYRGEMVVVEDIETDPLWEDYKHIALKYGLRACWSVPLIAKNGRVLGTFATYHDRPYRPHPLDFAVINRLASYMAIAIQRSQLHADLIAARDNAEAASQAKSQFLANMSHELRTPLNAILGFSEIIANQSFGPDARQRYIEYATDIHDSGTYLLSLINDVLDVARVEAGKVRINREHCGVVSVVEEQLRVVRRAYPGSGPDRSRDRRRLPGPSGRSSRLRADPDQRRRQCLQVHAAGRPDHDLLRLAWRGAAAAGIGQWPGHSGQYGRGDGQAVPPGRERLQPAPSRHRAWPLHFPLLDAPARRRSRDHQRARPGHHRHPELPGRLCAQRARPAAGPRRRGVA